MNDKYHVLSIYGILFAQWCVTFVVTYGLYVSPFVLHTLLYSSWLLPVLQLLSVILILILYLMCSLSYWWRVGVFAWLTFNTSAMVALLVCTWIALGYTNMVRFACYATMAVFATISLIVFIAYDTNQNNLIVVFEQLLLSVLVLLVIGIVMNLSSGCWLNLLGILVFTCYIVVDTWCIVEHSKGHSRDPLFSTIELYLDILNLFVFIVDYILDDE